MLRPVDELNQLEQPAFAEALRVLFEAAEPLTPALYAARPYSSYAALIECADRLASAMPEADQIAIVNAHPRIGESVARMSAISAREQGASAAQTESDAPVTTELAALNGAYEQRFGFRFVVFVNGRPRSEIVEVLGERLRNPCAAELRTALGELFLIARDRLATFETC